VKIGACGVCRTDLHVVDGEPPDPKTPIIAGHEIVGRIDAIGAGVEGLRMGDRVGVPWLDHTCGACPYCTSGHENLCDRPLFTGYTRDGGFATTTIADARYAFPLGEAGDDVAGSPALRRPHRLALPDACRRRQEVGPLWLRRSPRYRRAGRKMGAAVGVRFHPAGRCRYAGIRATPRRNVGRRVRQTLDARVAEVRHWLRNYQQLKQAIETICELNHELLRSGKPRQRPRKKRGD
jgi:hypothetical protein